MNQQPFDSKSPNYDNPSLRRSSRAPYRGQRAAMRTFDRKKAMNMLFTNNVVLVSIGIIILTIIKRRNWMGVHRRTFTILDRIPAQMKNMSYLCVVSDEDCRDQLRMDRATFHKLCFILQSVYGLKPSRRVVSPQAINADNTDPRWSQFQLHDYLLCCCMKGCLGALDGTHIDLHVPI
ncbi:hypothetical protein ACS0TY_018344 [Phlomoides rotata]